MAGTFIELANRADFSGGPAPLRTIEPVADNGGPPEGEPPVTPQTPTTPAGAIALGGLVYSIQITFPESRDQAVSDALFRGLKTHLLQ